jgi:hypothetical protein
MTAEQLLLSALSAVSGGLCFLFKIIWERSKQCEDWRAEKEPLIAEMAERLGLAQGAAKLVNACRMDGCPFAGKLDANTYSVEREKEHEHKHKIKP